MSPIHTLMMFGLTGLAFLLISTFVFGLGVSYWRNGLRALQAQRRHSALVAVTLAPAVTGLALLLSASLPAIAALLVPKLDHCALHDDHHVHLCFIHPPTGPQSLWIPIALVTVCGYFGFRFLLAFLATRKALRSLSSLSNTSEFRKDLGAKILQTDLPLCFAAGLLAPQVYVSRGLLNSTTESERHIVLLHEFAHVERRDTLIAVIVRVFGAFHIPPIKRFLLEEIQVAAEQICDESAATAVGDRLAVASAILTVERATRLAPTPDGNALAVAFGECAVERRVEALLDEARTAENSRSWLIAVAVTMVALVALTNEFHHLTETLLSAIVS